MGQSSRLQELREVLGSEEMQRDLDENGGNAWLGFSGCWLAHHFERRFHYLIADPVSSGPYAHRGETICESLSGRIQNGRVDEMDFGLLSKSIPNSQILSKSIPNSRILQI